MGAAQVQLPATGNGIVGTTRGAEGRLQWEQGLGVALLFARGTEQKITEDCL